MHLLFWLRFCCRVWFPIVFLFFCLIISFSNIPEIAVQKGSIISKRKLIIINRIASVDYVEREMKRFLTNVANSHISSVKLASTEWENWSIPWELCKTLKFYDTNKWYMNKPNFILKNTTHKILWNFEIQINHQINKKKRALPFSRFCRSTGQFNENVRKRKKETNTLIFPQKQKKPSKTWSGCPRGVMVKVMDSGIVESEFEFKSRYYVHFRTNTLEKGMNPLILPAMG